MKNTCLIICQSIYNMNTLKLARAMAQTLGCSCVTPGEALSLNLNDYRTIGLGSGIYFGKHHPELFEIVEKLHSGPQEVFIFSSRGNPRLGKYHKALREALLRKEKKVIGDFSVRGYDETGPWVIIGGGHRGKPDEMDLKKAVHFVKTTLPYHCMPDYYIQIQHKRPIREGESNFYTSGSNGAPVFLKGDRVTFNQNNCNGCGKCVEVCPLRIIQIENRKAMSRRELDCTLCRLCVDNCRQRAITLHYNWRDAISVAHRHRQRTSLY